MGYIFNVLNIATVLVLLIICILKFKDDIDVLWRKSSCFFNRIHTKQQQETAQIEYWHRL
ncbi:MULTISPECIES: hypothetical protein [Bacillus cereus group]|uniref:hypothetical protein n=1 Tax=Bacillus cereus group TaxID=86661 RepID=UPI000BF4AAAD|nr:MULTISPECIES: hypothetical protein [Bacillus cereus group]PEO77431.1 hypothetical protein CN570_19815 [Bacillus toyonensis]